MIPAGHIYVEYNDRDIHFLAASSQQSIFPVVLLAVRHGRNQKPEHEDTKAPRRTKKGNEREPQINTDEHRLWQTPKIVIFS